MLDALAGQSWLKKFLWRDDIGARIAQAYKDLSEAARLFNVSDGKLVKSIPSNSMFIRARLGHK
jgi:hypothetical protein